MRLETCGFEARRDEVDLSVGRHDEKRQARRHRRDQTRDVAIVGRGADEQDVDLVGLHALAQPREPTLERLSRVLRHAPFRARALRSVAVAGSSTVDVAASMATP